MNKMKVVTTKGDKRYVHGEITDEEKEAMMTSDPALYELIFKEKVKKVETKKNKK